MLVKTVRFFAARTTFTAALWALLVGFGLLAYTTLMPRQGFPSVQIPVVVMSGGYFVDDAEAVDAEVTTPIVDQIVGADGVDSVNSTSRASSFTIAVVLDEGQEVAHGVELLEQAAAAANLPVEAQFQIQTIDGALLFNEYNSLVAVYGPPGATATELEEAARGLLADFEGRDEVRRAEVIDLISRGVDPATGQEVSRQSGFTQIAVDEGEGLAPRPAVAVGLAVADGFDDLDLRDATDAVLASAAVADALPDGYGAVVAVDSATSIGQQIGSLQSNVITGLVAVTLIALLLISWRASILAAGFIATVLAVTMGVLHAVGMTLNTVSLFGVILSLGLFVDDAIVITEAIEAFRSEAEKPLDIISRAIKRVGAASISGTITTLLVFAPMLAISGILGEFISILPISVMIALTVSLVLSLIFLPLAARLFILSHEPSRGLLAPVETRMANRLASLIERSGSAGLATAAAGIGLSVAMTAVGLLVFMPRLEFNIFPPQKDVTEIEATYLFPPGTTIEEAEALTAELNQEVTELLGADVLSAYTYYGGTNQAVTRLNLTPIGDRRPAPTLIASVLDPFAQGTDGAQVVFNQVAVSPPVALFPFQTQVFGEDPEVLAAAAEQMAAELDGQSIARPNGSSFSVLETKVELADVVARTDGRRYVEVQARFDADDVSTVTSSTRGWFQEQFPPSRLTDLGLDESALGFDFGMESDNQESFASLPRAFAVALLAMLVLLVIQFRSTVQWSLVFLAIPFSMFGVFGGLLLTDNPISFFVMLGLLGLIGIAVNNTILLVDFANQERRSGADPRTAISTAIRRRFRPLVATTLTTVAGILPLALSDPFWEALGYTIIFGLLSSTFLVLVAFPYYYLAIEWIRGRWTSPWRPTGSTEGPEGISSGPQVSDEGSEGSLVAFRAES